MDPIYERSEPDSGTAMNRPLNEAQLPGVVVIGVAKAGTTSLYQWLGLHPEICPSSVKETNFLSDQIGHVNQSCNIHKHGLKSYGKFFSHWQGEKLCLEATPSYYTSTTALATLSSLERPPHLIVSLRDPVEQLFSFYQFDVLTRHKLPKATRFADYLDSPLGAGLIETAMYAQHLAPWQDRFGDRLKVLIFEEWTQHPEATMAELFAWLGLDSSVVSPADFVVRNRTRQIRSRRLHMFSRNIRQLLPRSVHAILRPVYLWINAKNTTTKQREQAAEDFDRLRNLFDEPNRQLLNLLNRAELPWR